MPSWVSDGSARWHPAKESVSLKNISNKAIVVEMKDDAGKIFKRTVQPGADYIYEGPDRAAMYQWWEENGRPSAEEMKKNESNVTFGEDFKSNTEFMEQYAKFRNMFGFKDVDEYLKYLGFDQVKAQKRFEDNASVVRVHDLPSRSPEIKKLGGGRDYATGKNNVYGGFGDPAELSK